MIVVDDDGATELVEIDDYDVPLAAPRAGYWALLNLLLALGTVFAMIIIAVIHFMGKKDDDTGDDYEQQQTEEEEKTRRVKRWLVYLSPVPAIAAVILFLLTEDMTRTIALTDRWTIWMIIIFIIELLLMLFSRKKQPEEEEEIEGEEEKASYES